jgi:hypothetical protein
VLATDVPRADEVPEYAAKYAERIGAMFGTARQFADLFTEAIVITPRVLRTAVGWPSSIDPTEALRPHCHSKGVSLTPGP